MDAKHQRRRPRYMRRSTLGERLRSAPQDWMLRMQEDWETFDWDNCYDATSLPIGLALNLLLIVVHLIQCPPADDHFYVGPDSKKDEELGPFASFSWVAELVLMAVSVGNAYCLFGRYRNYQLLYAGEEVESKSKNIHRVEFNARSPATDAHSQTAPSRSLPATLSKLALVPLKIILAALMKIFSLSGNESRHKQQQIRELRIWERTKFNEKIFILYSPINVAVIYLELRINNLVNVLAILVVVCLALGWIFDKFEKVLIDQKILFDQYVNEYDLNFVYPRVFVRKFDLGVSCSTECRNEDEADGDNEDTGGSDYPSHEAVGDKDNVFQGFRRSNASGHL